MMEKNKNSKRILVRNTEQKLPKTVVRIEPHGLKSASISLSTDKNINGKSSKKPTVNPFTEPKLHTTLRLVEEIKKTEQLRPKKIKNVKDIKETEKKIIEEKVTKSVNFPPTETIYKDLISLEISDDDVIPCIAHSSASREVNIPKDIEPQLIDYYKPIKKHEYCVTVKPPKIADNTQRKYSSLSLHKKMQSWVSDSHGVQINKTMY